ncbi:UvrD-helicase domain-containing protein [Bacillus sp. AGMB 02131]|uniref:UvrD-helicase domain-containing protein n=1 Tax=Peribacillus faecalis TaxID=2772559 RepID=A0A927CZB3_9BACI|nr:RNA polymerase recycling motor HelD [Peribacillus faecalis]MBD3109781.1 UvrD-helicase domain-containing protein [Peribacillus faecalis]
MANKQDDRAFEEQRIKDVIQLMEERLNVLRKNSGGLKKDVISLRNTFWDDVRVNMDNPEDAAETLSSIKQQAQLLSERERTHHIMHKQQVTLTRMKDSPYFARVDFIEEGTEDTIHVYLGVASLMDEAEENFLIYDWRAPISSIYYDFSPGSVQYETSYGTVSGEMKLKRQFIIKYGELKSMFDTGVTIGDELLKEVLGTNASHHMKNIVATIQREQNQIIRNVRNRYLIVQGAAGSGKTSVALQRVAYLLYRYKDEITADNIMLFSPNALFNRYVASVLPDLGEENMQQMTFQEYAQQRLSRLYKMEHPFMQMEYILIAEDDSDYKARTTGIRFKASFTFKTIIDQYVKMFSKSGLVFKNIKFRGEVIISSEEMSEYFYSLDYTVSIPNRIQILKEWLLAELEKIEVLERDKEWVYEESELLDLEEYTEVYSELRKEGRFSEDSFDDFEQEQSKLAIKIVRKYFKPIRNAITKLKFLHTKLIYRQLFTAEFPFAELLPDNWDEICGYTVRKLQKNELSYEDAAPFLYLQDQLEGHRINTNIRHLLIDEAQDYSPFQFFVIKQLFPASKMTILGDFNQAIYAHSFHAPTLLSDELYANENVEKVVLKKSYRSTKQIIEFAKKIIEQGEEIEAFDRNGPKPTITKTASAANIIDRVNKLQAKNYETVAILCKTAKECEEAYVVLKEELDIQLIKLNANTYEKGILIMPAYLAKGIEFDAVIIYDASRKTYSKEQERKLFYTACTRAMHELHLFFVGELTPFLDHVSEQLYSH